MSCHWRHVFSTSRFLSTMNGILQLFTYKFTRTSCRLKTKRLKATSENEWDSNECTLNNSSFDCWSLRIDDIQPQLNLVQQNSWDYLDLNDKLVNDERKEIDWTYCVGSVEYLPDEVHSYSSKTRRKKTNQ